MTKKTGVVGQKRISAKLIQGQKVQISFKIPGNHAALRKFVKMKAVMNV